MGLSIAVVRIFLVISLLGGICGCATAPPTADGVRSLGPESQFVFIVPEEYQSVYRIILGEMRKCFQMGSMDFQSMVQGDIYQDTRSGTITQTIHGGFSNSMYQVIDVMAIDNNQTRVIGHYAFTTESGRKKHAEALKEWIFNKSPMCDPK